MAEVAGRFEMAEVASFFEARVGLHTQSFQLFRIFAKIDQRFVGGDEIVGVVFFFRYFLQYNCRI